ncbi:uncharacterized protein [Lolium perenne]|uniref:uncharacterized protein isoform X2 n=2 Tax=Lolium perenne TaxID=4522 RepID=UPI003A993029
MASSSPSAPPAELDSGAVGFSWEAHRRASRDSAGRRARSAIGIASVLRPHQATTTGMSSPPHARVLTLRWLGPRPPYLPAARPPLRPFSAGSVRCLSTCILAPAHSEAQLKHKHVESQNLDILICSHHIHWHYSPSAWSSAFDAMEAMAAVRTDSTCVAERKIPKDNSIKMPSHVNSVVGATASGLERARGKADSGVGLWSTRDLIYLIVYQWISAAGQRCSRDGRGQSFEDGVYLRWYQQIVLHDSFRSRRYHILKEILIMACTSRVPVDLGGFSAAATCATII